MHEYKAMRLEAALALLRIPFSARGVVLGVGARAPHARAPPHIRGGRGVGAPRSPRTPSAVTLSDPLRSSFGRV
jgi:hypothetical protein